MELPPVSSSIVESDLTVVKCVVVGDNAAGKTRLICARACGTTYTMRQLITTHVPTVWAIDHYRSNLDIFNKSWTNVDGLQVSLRLWDTFGYHDKDRRFAYSSADVILLCFSVIRPRTLKNVLSHWNVEIRKHLPKVPIVLCGCQVDMRYLWKDEQFIKLEKGPLFQKFSESDILFPESGHAVAKQIGAHYYETSVLEPFGIEELFTNVCRAALHYKKEKHFWNNFGVLKHILPPLSQSPHLVPRTAAPEFPVLTLSKEVDFSSLFNERTCHDVVFNVQGVHFYAHRICLSVVSPLFFELFQKISQSLSSKAPDPISPTRDHSTDIVSSLQPDMTLLQRIWKDLTLLSRDKRSSVLASVFSSIEVSQDEGQVEGKVDRTVVSIMVSEQVQPAVFHSVLHYIYSGMFVGSVNLYEDILDLSRVFSLTTLTCLVAQLKQGTSIVEELSAKFHKLRIARIKELCLTHHFLADVYFEVDDGLVPAHRTLLALRSEMMLGMFRHNFTEQSSTNIPFPDVNSSTFHILLEYLYTGACPRLDCHQSLDVIELANRLCLSDLLLMAESSAISDLATLSINDEDISETVISLLEAAQLHNANHLAAWCLWYISVNYDTIYRQHSKLLFALQPENQIYLSVNRWPPQWYFKEKAVYEKNTRDMERLKVMSKQTVSLQASPKKNKWAPFTLLVRKK